MDPLTLDFTVRCTPAHAFAVWATWTSAWWPSSHSVSGDARIAVTIEPHPGGRIFERTPAGEEHDWGEVLEWEPPHRLAYLWHLRQDRADATRVEISFRPEGECTCVSIVHSGVGTPRRPRRTAARPQPPRLGRTPPALRQRRRRRGLTQPTLRVPS